YIITMPRFQPKHYFASLPINLLKAEKLQEQKLALQEKEQLNESLQESQIQLIEREQQLEYEVLHDALTGIPNRNWLSEHLENVIQSREDFAILFIDLDRFKIINDSLGHLVGDEILKQATKRIRAVLPEFASLSRFGGDEFVVLVEEAIDLNTLTNLSDLIQLQLQLPFYLNNYELFISASIGITISHEEEYTHPEEVLRDADLAMYKAKHQGRGRYATFTHGDRVAAMSRLHMERDLRQALEQEEFYLHYQPIVSLETLHIIGFEALVRWHHPSGQPISPTQFITVAEETGLINSLGWWIMREACQQIHQWNQQLGVGNWLSVNVNVSPVQLRQVDFLARVKQILHETGLPYDLLKLEITESCLLDNIDGTNELFAQFKELGIKLCIDDFGTGYSSLSRLHELPIDTLKIDQSFVKRIGSAADSVAMIQTISSLADSLQISSVAEGIETQSQLDELIAIGCHLGQGYLFAKSCSAEDAWELLQKLAPKHGSSQMLPSVSR
ncbi:MAG: EAL domain-containing protein, partial [Pseudanabaena sp. ELA607]